MTKWRGLTAKSQTLEIGGCRPVVSDRQSKNQILWVEELVKKTALAAGPWRKSAPCRNPRPSCRDPAIGNPFASEGPITFKQDRRNHFATAEFRTEATGTPDMTEFDTGQGKSVANAVRQLLRSEDYRRHLHGVLNLAVDPRLPSTFVPLLEALDQAGREPFRHSRSPNE
jgi:hypothetical protein